MKKPKSKSEPKVKPEAKAELKPSGPKKKAMAGKVTFQDLSRQELEVFRVIPESGEKLIVSKNQSYGQVDGFWWRGRNPGEWNSKFRIPASPGSARPRLLRNLTELLIAASCMFCIEVIPWFILWE
jgi:hypothetical protein